LARRLGVRMLATNDSHYTREQDATAHDALLCVQTGATIDDPKRFRFDSDEHYLKSAAEMRARFAELPEACDATLALAEEADVEIAFGLDALPTFPVPDDVEGATQAEREARYLERLAREGAARRYGTPVPSQVQDRLAYELDVIRRMGFSGYFLVVADLVAYAKQRGIRVGPGRGSAAGCLVAYCLGIVELDPVAHDLIFERFLNPGRKQMPDIDIDFDERYRGEMIAYVARRYGADRVAQIVTFSTIKARAAVRDAARVLGLPYAVGDRIAKAMPPLVMGRDTPLRACFEPTPGYEDGYAAAAELRAMYESDPDVRRVVDVARGLEGLRRQDGVHAAAVVITREPLTEYLPVQRKPEPGQPPEDAPLVTQYEMHAVEALGLLKMDFLGLRNLSVIDRTLELIEATRGERPDIDRVALDDEATFEMLRRGETVGVFQLEGREMRQLVRQLQPTTFDDVAALVALYRPGPMAAGMHREYAERKNGRSPVTYLHPDLEPILKDTYGLMIYQEQVMRVAERFAGYSLEEADNLRKACGKKIRELIAAERERFVAGCEAQGYGRALGERLFDVIEPFADYAFNKSHSYGYGLVAYQTAWLKANYPVEYMAALLTSVADDKDKTATYLAECRALGIEVLPPDVNRSVAAFTPVVASSAEGAIRQIVFGLAAVRNVGDGLCERIVEERERGGPYRSFVDFCMRVDPAVLNKRAVESLIKAGAFDSLGHPRKGLLKVAEAVVERALARRREEAAGIATLFAAVEPADGQSTPDGFEHLEVPQEEFDRSELLAAEKEMLGLYVSDHPLAGLEALLAEVADTTIADLRDAVTDPLAGDELLDGEPRAVAGIVTALRRRYTKRGELMASFVLEDLTGSIEVLVFPRAMEDVGSELVEDRVVLVRGRLDARDDDPRLVLQGLEPLDFDPHARAVLRVRLPDAAVSGSTLEALKALLAEHPGEETVELELAGTRLRLPEPWRVDSTNGLCGLLRERFGADAVVRERSVAREPRPTRASAGRVA
jgi:DNA polymerase-3 subunit alpha